MYFFNRKTINNLVEGLFNWSVLPEIRIIEKKMQECIFCQTENIIPKDSKACHCQKCDVHFLV